MNSIFSILKMKENGIVSYHLKDWIGTKPACQKTIIEVVPVDLIQFSWALYVMVGGIHLSTLILFAEILVHRYHTLNSIDVKDVLKNWFRFGQIEDEKKC